MKRRARLSAFDMILAFAVGSAVLAATVKGDMTLEDMPRLLGFMAFAAAIGSGFGHAVLALKDALVAAWERRRALGVPSAPELVLCAAQTIVRAGGGGPFGFDATEKFNQVSALNMILESQRQVRRLEAVGILPPLETFAFHDGGKVSHHKRENI